MKPSKRNVQNAAAKSERKGSPPVLSKYAAKTRGVILGKVQ